jgi:hypothetical protein
MKLDAKTQLELEKLFYEYSEKVCALLGNPYHVCSLLHKVHLTPDEVCTGTAVLSDADPQHTIGMLHHATLLVMAQADEQINPTGVEH